MYLYDNNPMMIVQFSCIVISLLSIVGVIIVFLLGKGWKYFIATIFFTQIISMLFFFVPQVLTPFFFNGNPKDQNDEIDRDYNNEFCQFKNDLENKQFCINQTFCKLQGYFVNSSFLASTLISLYSCYIIKQTLNANPKFGKNINQIYIIHFIIGIVTFIICLPMLIVDVEFQHYGTSWNKELVYYICNLKVSSDQINTQMLFWGQSFFTFALIILSLIFHYSVSKLKKKIKKKFVNEFDSCSSLNLYVLPITLLIFWTINMIIKLFDSEKNFIREQGNFVQGLFFFPQLLLALQGFNYASLFFYAFYQQLVPNLPKSLQSTYMFFAKISIYNCFFGKIAEYKIPKNSLLYDADSAKDSTSSIIQKDESSTNR
ncbi:unnamed protein product [Paramecium sonneborni]|uniref:Uncharacterized protein n=1 Tax=Paramecium sonneborni TaxID=65129 RepID=A0A8S1NC71_9CILI|nr:unnamed protein product [Paramecium sonneborni]